MTNFSVTSFSIFFLKFWDRRGTTLIAPSATLQKESWEGIHTSVPLEFSHEMAVFPGTIDIPQGPEKDVSISTQVQFFFFKSHSLNYVWKCIYLYLLLNLHGYLPSFKWLWTSIQWKINHYLPPSFLLIFLVRNPVDFPGWLLSIPLWIIITSVCLCLSPFLPPSYPPPFSYFLLSLASYHILKIYPQPRSAY